MELTVLGCSGSYGAPAGGACSGYLVRAGDASIWMDCGNGTFAHLQQHLEIEDLTAVVLTHGHPDHCVDIYGLHVMLPTPWSARGQSRRTSPSEFWNPQKGTRSSWRNWSGRSPMQEH